MKTKPHNKRHGRKNTPATHTHQVIGELRIHPRGFGFVESGNNSYFVSGNLIGGALDGDKVRAGVAQRRGGNRSGAEVEEYVVKLQTVERVRTHVVGTWLGDGRVAVDPGIGFGELRATGSAASGETVVLRAVKDGWRVAEKLGGTYQEDSLYRRIMERHRLPHRHENSTVEEARKIAAKSAKKRRHPKRKNLTNQTVITIDADHSKDLDDALSIQLEKNGNIRVFVHIADVAEHVAEGSLVDRAAAECPTSVYLPMRVRPMLPPEISEAALSLLPGVERDTLTVEMLIDCEGHVIESKIYESFIKSMQRISYTSVARIIRGEETEVDLVVKETVGWLWHAAQRIGVQRRVRGGVPSNLIGEEPGDDDDAHMLVERLMVQANETVARWLEDRKISALYRCHQAPSDEAIGEIEHTACELGQFVAFSRPVSPVSFGAFYQQIERSVDLPTLRDMLAGVLETAEYTCDNYGHFGLGSKSYVHFTSPLRRYADLLVHRTIKAHLRGESTKHHARYMREMSNHITEISARAGRAERDVRLALALCEIERQPRRRSGAVIRSINETKIRVETDDNVDVVGHIAARKLGSGWRFDARRHEGVSDGKLFRVGGRIEVETARVDALSGTLEYALHKPGRGRDRAKAARGSQSRRERTGRG